MCSLDQVNNPFYETAQHRPFDQCICPQKPACSGGHRVVKSGTFHVDHKTMPFNVWTAHLTKLDLNPHQPKTYTPPKMY